MDMNIQIYLPTSSERRACETTAIKIHHAFQNPSPSSKAAAKAAQDDPCLQQPRLDGAKSDQLFFYGGHSSAQSDEIRRHRPPKGLVQNPANLCKSVLPPAQECQIAHWSTLSDPVESTCHPKPSKQ